MLNGKHPEMTDQEIQNWIAPQYLKRYSGTGFLYHARIVTDMLRGLRLKDKVLDVGCGIGLVSQLHPNFDILGIDLADEMLKRNPYNWRKMDAEKLDFESDYFDVVVCRSLLHHLEHPKKGLEEMFRVLKPGGKWVSWEPNYSFFSELFRKAVRSTDRFSHIHMNFRADEFTTMLENAGFKVTETKFIGFLGYPLLGFPDIHNFKIPLGLARVIIGIDNLISRTPFKRLAWSLKIQATKGN